jgi:putative DNA primase/helicase
LKRRVERAQHEEGVEAMPEADWSSRLLKNKQGAYLPCTSNIALILTHRREWRNVLFYDAFAGDVVTRKVPPWDEDTMPENARPGDWTHTDTLRTCAWVTREYNCAPLAVTVGEAVLIVAERTTVHPVRDWLVSLKWDRRPRLDDFLIRLAGAADTAYVRAVSKNFLIGAVARVLAPGSKVDSMPIFEGDQGIGKSTLLRVLTGEEWFLETSIEIGSKDCYQALRRKWIVELGELDALTRSEVSRVKQFLSSQKDSYRPSYGRSTVDFLRQSVCAGSVNPEGGGYLKDVTGARRFWPLELGRIDIAGIKREREQLWAEATFRYRKCEKWHFRDPRLLSAAAQEAEDRRQIDPWEPIIAAWLEDHNRSKRGVTTREIMESAIGIPPERHGRGESMRTASALRAIGWSKVSRVGSGERRYHRSGTSVRSGSVSVP